MTLPASPRKFPRRQSVAVFYAENFSSLFSGEMLPIIGRWFPLLDVFLTQLFGESNDDVKEFAWLE
jgi:hypothetical protein